MSDPEEDKKDIKDQEMNGETDINTGGNGDEDEDKFIENALEKVEGEPDIVDPEKVEEKEEEVKEVEVDTTHANKEEDFAITECIFLFLLKTPTNFQKYFLKCIVQIQNG